MENLKANIELARTVADNIVQANAAALKIIADLSVKSWTEWNKQVDATLRTFEASLSKKD